MTGRAGCWVLLQFLICCSSWVFLDAASFPQSCPAHIKPAVPSAKEGSACITSAGFVEWRGEDRQTDKGLREPGLEGQAEIAAHFGAGWCLCTSPSALWEMGSWTVSSNPSPVKKERSQARGGNTSLSSRASMHSRADLADCWDTQLRSRSDLRFNSSAHFPVG